MYFHSSCVCLVSPHASPFVAQLTFFGCFSLSDHPKDHASRHIGVPTHYAESSGLGERAPVSAFAGWLNSFDDPVLTALVHET